MYIRFFKKNETELLQNAIDRIWAKNHVLSKDEVLLDHMFYENPCRQDVIHQDAYSFLGIWYEDEIVGLLGTIPLSLNVKGKREIGFCLTNWIVDEKHRKTVNGIDLLEAVKSYNPSFILSLGINPKVSGLYRMMKWRVVNQVPRWIGISNRKKFQRFLGKQEPSVIDALPDVRFAFHAQWEYMVSRDNFDAEKWDACYHSIAKHTIGFARDSKFIQWRYLNHPSFHYQTIVCLDESFNYHGLAVFRIETVGDYKIGRVLEFMASDANASIQLANALVTHSEEVTFWDFYCTSSTASFGLETCGFVRLPPSHYQDLKIPSRFQPIDFEQTTTMASMFVSEKLSQRVPYLDINDLYITKGDSDQDRPN